MTTIYAFFFFSGMGGDGGGLVTGLWRAKVRAVGDGDNPVPAASLGGLVV